MLSFHRLFSALAVVASFVLLAAARPAHRDLASLHARDATGDMVAKLQTFKLDLSTHVDALTKAAGAGGDLTPYVKGITSTFSPMAAVISIPNLKLTPELETAVTDAVVDSMKSVATAAYKTKDMKMYPLWTDMDASMYGFYMSLARVSFPAFKACLAKAGSESARYFHDLHMRNMVNLLGGSGYGY